MNDDKYRKPTSIVETMRDWDVILLHGGVRLIGIGSSHWPFCQPATSPESCHCFSRPRISSSIVDQWKRPLVESAYQSQPLTGEARYLLALTAGDEIETVSEKTYRLDGPRRYQGHKNLEAASIFHVYAEEDAQRKAATTKLLKRDIVVVVAGLLGSALLSVLGG